MSEMGHNGGLSQGAFHGHVAAIARAQAEMDLARKKLSKARKAAKADGILLKDLDRALTLADMTREEQRTQMNALTTYLRWLNAPLGSQLALFEIDGEEDPATGLPVEPAAEALDRARSQGFLAGISGRPEDNPNDASHPNGLAWLEAYREGRAKFDEVPEPGSSEDDDDA